MKYFFDGILNFYYLLFFQHEQWKTVAMMLLFCLSAKQQSTHKSEEKEEEITKNEERRRDSELLSDNWIKFKSLFQWLCCMEKQKTTSGCEKEIFFASFHLFRREKFHPLFRNECFCFASVDGRVKINRMSMCLTQKMKKIKKSFKKTETSLSSFFSLILWKILKSLWRILIDPNHVKGTNDAQWCFSFSYPNISFNVSIQP